MDEPIGGLEALVLERTRLDEAGKVVGTGETQRLETQLVLRSIGYRSVALPGVPFDERAAVISNVEGRIVDAAGVVQPREYVVGWIKRGPTGVIGTNKSDASQTVRHLVADLVAARAEGSDDFGAGAGTGMTSSRTSPCASTIARTRCNWQGTSPTGIHSRAARTCTCSGATAP